MMIESITETDIVVIGAGPAGLCAAVTAARYGASVVLCDENETPGGQIYRGVAQSRPSRNITDDILGAEYQQGTKLIREFDAVAGDTAQYDLKRVQNATIWQITEDGRVTFSVTSPVQSHGEETGGEAKRNSKAYRLQAKKIIIATGAHERPVPIAGWTLPGAMTVGAAQIMIKTAAVVPQRAVLAGSGPLLYLLAAQLIRSGTPPVALVETQNLYSHLRAMRYSVGALKGRHLIHSGLRLLKEIKKARVPRYVAATDLSIRGSNVAEALEFSASKVGGILPGIVSELVPVIRTGHRVQASTVLLHQGVVPNTQLTHSLRLAHQWNEQQACFQVVVNKWGESSQPNIVVIGDGAAINGASAAELSGAIGALNAVCGLGRIDNSQRDKLAAPIFAQLHKETAARAFLDALYAPPDELKYPADKVIVCRCESVSAGEIRRYAAAGCRGPNQTKAYSRCGMGPCQGRYCGLTVTTLLARENNQTPQDTGAYRIRSPIKPVTLGELASLD